MSDLLHDQTLIVTQVQVGPPDAAGVPIETTTTQEWGPCIVQRRSTTEVRDRGDVVTTRLWASGPLAEWIDEHARISWRGHDYQVDGQPAHFLAGALDHTEVDLITWTGR